MDTKKTIKNFAIFLLCFSAVALAGVNIYQYIQIKQATQTRLSEAPSGDDATVNPMPPNMMAALEHNGQNHTVTGGKSQPGDNEIDELMYQLDAATEELAVIKEQMAADEAKKAKQEEIQKELLKKSMGNQANKEALKKSLDFQYADLYKKLSLSPEKLDEFKDLQAEQMLAQQNIFLDYNVTGDLTKEEQEEIGRRHEELYEEYESKIGELLGESEYATYQSYSETQGERYRVNNFMEYLGSGETLTETQKESLIEAMHEELEYVVYDRPDEVSEDYSSMSDEVRMERSLTNYSRTNEAYFKAANSVLSAAQLEKFEAYLQEETERFRLILEMSALRSGTSDESDNVAIRVE